MGVMNVLVVEPCDERRASLVHAICELRNVHVRASTASALESLEALTSQRIDVVVFGDLSAPDRAYLMRMAGSGCRFVESDDLTEMTVRLAELGLRGALSHHLRTAHSDTHRLLLHGTQTLHLHVWLPEMIARIRSVIPGYIELVPMISADTPPVQCIPAVVEHVMLELILKAAAKLPWGGTIWLTAERSALDEVRLDILENGHGTFHDLTLRASPAVCS